jgi:ParB-like chromosome segregation protein Spo0J
LNINELLGDAPVDPRAHLDAERVAHYAHTPDPVPPVVVYETPQGRLLVDGYHRIAAAQQRGATTIEAEIRHGSRHDALQYAAANAAARRGITPQEAIDHIERHSY